MKNRVTQKTGFDEAAQVNSDRVQILNVGIDNLSLAELLQQLERGMVVTPNVDHLIKLQQDKEFFEVYNKAHYRICDSQVLLLFSRFLGTPLKEKISGSDFLPYFCDFHKNNPETRVFLLGGGDGVAHEAQQNINRRLGRKIVVGAHSPSYGFEKNEAECQAIVDLINRSDATVLAVGVGAPKQEKWIAKYMSQLPKVRIFMAVGAAIDFEAGRKPRSPAWMSHFGVEWVHRLLSEPRRLWKRYLIDDLPFLWLIVLQRLNFYRPPFDGEDLNN